MNRSDPTSGLRRLMQATALSAWLALTACGGSGGETPEARAPDAPGREISAAGGVVDGPDGARLAVPAGALEAPARIAIAKDATFAPGLPAGSGMRLASNVFSITPHGQGFAAPVRVTLPFDATQVRSDEQLVLLKAAPGGDWRVHTDVTRDGAFASAEVRDFSVFAIAARVRTPFSFRVAVSGTTPQLRVSYTFSGTVPVCRYGLEVQTVFRYRLRSFFNNARWIGVGWTNDVSSSTTLHDQQVLVVPGGIAEAEQGHDVLQPMLPAPVAGEIGGPSTTYEYQYYPLLTARVVCRGEEFVAGPGGGVVVAPMTWTYQAENSIDLGQHQGPLALVEDIGDIETTVGQPATSQAQVQMRGDWGASLLASSRWMIRRSDTQAWSELSRADRLDALPTPGQIQEQGGVWSLPPVLPLNSLVRLGTTIADPASVDDGAEVRLVACVDPALASPGCVTGTTRRLRFSATAVAPLFTRQPAGAVVPVGQPISFVATATGAPAPTLQWQRFDGTAWNDVAGATASQLTIASPSRSDDGVLLRLRASNSAGSATSAVVRLNVVDQAAPPVVVATSGDLAVARGGSAVFAAHVSGTAPLSYQWYRGGAPIIGANTPILRLDDVQDGAAASYALEVSNPAGRTRSAAQQLSVTSGTVEVAPQITTQPVATTVGTGHTATFAVAVSGTGPFAFQWYRGGQPIAGATAAVYTIASASSADEAGYTVTISNSAGGAVSDSAPLTVLASGTTPVAPTITTQPAPLVVTPSGSATLAVAANGSAPLSYQWRRDGVDIAGAIGPVLTLAAAGGVDAGTYTVRVANGAGSVVSGEAAVVILGAPSIGAQPSAAAATAGQTATFSVAASGAQVRYQWLRNGAVITGATAASYTTPALTPADSGAVFAVAVFNGAGAVLSAPALLSVAPVPSVSDVAQVVLGPTNTCVRHTDGKLRCWGAGSTGVNGNGSSATLGDGAGEMGTALPPIDFGSGLDPLHVALKFRHACALFTLGRVKCWGSSAVGELGLGLGAGSPAVGNQPGQMGDGLPFVNLGSGVLAAEVAVGAGHTCIRDTLGRVKCWGLNDDGQAGSGDTVRRGVLPGEMGDNLPFVDLGSGRTATALAAGGRHTCALLDDRSVRCWGRNHQGQLGTGVVGSTGDQPGEMGDSLVPVPLGSGRSALAIAAGHDHTCALLDDGSLKCWGYNDYGQLGLGDTAERGQTLASMGDALPAVNLGSGRRALSLALSDSHTCALLDDATLKCWGLGSQGALGYESSSLVGITPLQMGDNRPAVNVGRGRTVLAVGAGFAFNTCAILDDRRLKCWGDNDSGSLGLGDTVRRGTLAGTMGDALPVVDLAR